MKLFFPNGEHAAVDLVDGVLVIGASPVCRIVLNAAGVAPRHCEARTHAGHTTLAPLAISAPTLRNGVPLTEPARIDAGDLLLIGSVACRVVAVERRAAVAAADLPRSVPTPGAAVDGRTRLRMTLPKYVLRGVSGVTFGKVFPVHGTMTLGRGSDCDIHIGSDEVSRHHARLQLVPDGVMVDDTGSANGTYVNDRRVTGPTLLKPGGELRVDVVRFLLIAPGRETEQIPAAATARGTPPPQSRRRYVFGFVLALIALALAAVAAYVMGLRP